jgi:hypothetical protein
MPKIFKRIIIYITIIILMYFLIKFNNDKTNTIVNGNYLGFLSTLVYIITIWTFFFDLLISTIVWFFKKYNILGLIIFILILVVIGILLVSIING